MMFIKDLMKGGAKKMENKLKPCPFCGNEDIKIEILQVKEDLFLMTWHMRADVRCNCCEVVKRVVVSGKNEEHCIERIIGIWNKRV